MNKGIRQSISRPLAAMLLVVAGMSAAYAQSDEDKLRELERAMSAPSEAPMAQPKRRTRAIVFDNQGDQGAAAPAAAPAMAAGPRDCAALPPDVKSMGVDFPIQFQVGSANISPASESTLSLIAKTLSLSDRCVIVEGHTDASGNADKNQSLSRDRAESVVNFLNSRSGIDRKRLVPVGKGSSDPVRNLDARDPKNRRVVFKVVTG